MFSFVFKTGFRNLGAKKLFSFASIATIACCVFVFCIFFILASNIESTMKKIESTVGIQVFFNEGLSNEQIMDIANENFKTPYVKSMKFKSGEEAWAEFKTEYFEDKVELAIAFEDDNPLINSSSYEILLNDITKQYEYVNMISKVEGVRQVNYSNILIEALTSFNFGITSFSLVLIALLVVVAMILISNTITLASQFRKKENEIMKLIGATNFMIRAPYVIEGFLIGLIGSIIPLVILGFLYKYLMKFIIEKTSFISSIFTPVSLYDIIFPMSIISVSFSCLICVFISSITIGKHLRI